MSKAGAGNFFEDFRIGQVIRHATPRTVTAGDVALYNGLFGPRFAVQSADAFAQALGYPRAPVDDLLVFHIVFGKTVPDVSLNAVANLGYAGCRFLAPVYPGDTLKAVSEVIGLKENSSRKTGIVFVRTDRLQARRQQGARIRALGDGAKARRGGAGARRSRAAAAGDGARRPRSATPARRSMSAAMISRWPAARIASAIMRSAKRSTTSTASPWRRPSTSSRPGSTRTPRASISISSPRRKDRFGRRLIYGGHVISLARALSFNGLANAFHIAAINGGRHVAPLFAGATVFAWSEVLAKAELPGRGDVGALRLRTVATKDRPCADFPRKVLPRADQGTDRGAEDEDDPAVLLDLDYWALIPR